MSKCRAAIRIIIRFIIALKESINQRRTLYPSVINLNVTNICDSHCRMCNIWRNTETKEFTVEEFSDLFSQGLFKKVKHVGITGGEPTLRSDLIEIAMSLILHLPELKGLSIITNSIKPERSFSAIMQLSNLCQTHNKSFSAMLSLDGIEEFHDLQRGSKGNFQSVLTLLSLLDNANFTRLSFGITLTKLNCYNAHAILAFAKEKDVYARFRIGEYIGRLNNSDSQIIRNFSVEESYHLYTFFYLLENQYEHDSQVKRTYRSIQHMLIGGKRLIGCPYRSNGIVVGAHGSLSFCAVRGKDWPKQINKSAKWTYFNSKEEKRRIMSYCDSCIHDYHNPITLGELVSRYFQYRIRSGFLKLFNSTITLNAIYLIAKLSASKQKKNFDLLIIGWYGTETCGDKAVLGEIISSYKESNPYASIAVASLNPVITTQTRRELGMAFEVIDVYSWEFLSASSNTKSVVIGGGPLMHIDELAILLCSFKLATKNLHERIIWGCGIGPLHKKWHKLIVNQILGYSTKIMLRDSDSILLVANELQNRTFQIKDPAKDYIERIRNSIKINSHEIPHITCFLRELPWEYFSNQSLPEFKIFKNDFEQGLALYLLKTCKQRNIGNIVFKHMHTFAIGNDDRFFSYQFTRRFSNLFTDLKIEIDPRPSNIQDIVTCMVNSSLNICMRYHSVVFADTLATDYVAIDYTQSGKIHSFLKDVNNTEAMLTAHQLATFPR